MAKTLSTMLPLGSKAPQFELPDCHGNEVSLEDFRGMKGLMVMFICNHCPYVLHVKTSLVAMNNFMKERQIGVVAINSNDPVAYPDDSPEEMTRFSRENQFDFPYLFDATQDVAKSYAAACTPDFYLFDQDLKLYYRGQLDGSRPGNDIPNDGVDLQRAAESLLSQKQAPLDQKPSIGCNIKWKPGAEPDYFHVNRLA